MIIRELSEFHDPRALETWSTASMLFQKYMAVNEKMSPPFVILQELLFLFVRYLFSPNSSVLLLAPRLEGKFGLNSRSYKKKTTHGQIQLQGGILCRLLIGTETNYIFDRECQFTRWSGSTKPHHSSSDTPRTEIFGLHTTVTHENAYIEPQAQRWKTHHTIDPQSTRTHMRLPIYLQALQGENRHNLASLSLSLLLSLSLT